MDTKWFKDLDSLAQTGNFSIAAEQSHVSQSAFSRRIRALEDWVGAQLVDRSHHPVHLTAAGKQMLEAGLQALSRIETERTQIRKHLDLPDGRVVTFATQHSIGWRFYPAWLQEFERAFGPIISRLRADDLPNCVADLREGEVDFVISYESAHAAGVDPATGILSRTIGIDRLIPVCKPCADGAPLFDVARVDAGAKLPFLGFTATAPIRKHIDPILKRRGLWSALEPVYENSMAGALRLRARDGLGVAWLPLSLVGPDLDAGHLTWAGGEDWAIEVEIRIHKLESDRGDLISDIWAFLNSDGEARRNR